MRARGGDRRVLWESITGKNEMIFNQGGKRGEDEGSASIMGPAHTREKKPIRKVMSGE